MMTVEQATAYVVRWADTQAEPALSGEDIADCILQARTVDRAGCRINEIGYELTIWGTRAVYLAWDLKVTRSVGVTDYSTDGTSVSASQAPQHIKEQRASWHARMIPGSV